MTYYAAARDADNRIRQLRVTAEPGQRTRQEWTAITYRTNREAAKDLMRLNGCLAESWTVTEAK